MRKFKSRRTKLNTIISVLTTGLQLIAIIGMIITIRQTNKSNREMEMSRLAAFRPFLKINHFSLKMESSEHKNIFFGLPLVSTIKNYTRDEIGLIMENIGNGAAYNLSYVWKFDKDSIMEKVSSLANRRGEEFRLLPNDRFSFHNVFYSNESIRHGFLLNEDYSGIFGDENTFLKEHNLPSQGSCIVYIPDQIINCIQLYLYLLLQESNLESIYDDEMSLLKDIFEMEPINLVIAYKDISGSSYEQLFQLRATFNGYINLNLISRESNPHSNEIPFYVSSM